MIVLLHSATGAGTLQRDLGLCEYSYYFVLKEFRPVLERLGLAVAVSDPQHEADEVLRQCRARGEDCVLFSFAPPHKTVVGLACPTVPVFAWEFDSLPDETWADESGYEDPRNDWRYGLGRLGWAITHSGHAAEATRRAMGDDFPVAVIPAPVWDRFAALPCPPAGESRGFTVEGRVLDTRALDLAPYASSLRRLHGYAPLPPSGEAVRVELGGVVYTSVFNPNDGRKNWFDMVGGFCWAFRDAPDATLVLKLTHRDNRDALSGLLEELSKLSPFACRVVLVDGFLGDREYEALCAATTYAVNTSHGEGQCLPLMEYMSAGKPAVAPAHTAMADYVSAATGFPVRSTAEPSHWPHDPRQAYRTLRQRLDFGALLDAYRESYRVARGDPARYARLSETARETMRAHCSQAATLDRVRRFLAQTARVPAPVSA